MRPRQIVWITWALCLALAPGMAGAQDPTSHFGLLWGQSRQEALDASKAQVISRALHQRYGTALEVDKLPVAVGGEIHRILYFDDDDKLLRVWIDFGHPGERVWAENYLLDEAIVKYKALKAETRFRGATCDEPELVLEEKDGEKILASTFVRDRAVWACEDERGDTLVRISLRRLGDLEGRRFDVIYDAQDTRAVANYRSQNRLEGGN